jgi:uncharacterized protein (TIGR01244 family)
MEPATCSLPKPTCPAQLSSVLSVGPAPTPNDIARLAEAGFRSIINNRPDTDQELTMTSAEVAASAAAIGLSYSHIPVEGKNPLEKDVKAFATALANLPHPIFAYCQSGGRSASLWALASVGEHNTEVLISKCRDIGFDISGLHTKMDMRREMLENGDCDE